MKRTSTGPASPKSDFPKCATGVPGIDEITGGGLPQGRPTLVCGGAGCGKTMLGIEFLVRGAVRHGDPGVLMAFEETGEELAANVRSLGYDLPALVRRKLLAIDHVRVERSEIEETGEYDLEGLFVRLGAAIDSIGAKRVVLDTIESLFSAFSNPMILRAELRRLFHWLKAKGVTAIITGERGDGTLTRQGLEEYVSDCVIVLDHRVSEQVSTRRLRIAKYRGSAHGSNEYPFLINEQGFSVLPVTSLKLDHDVSTERISSGIERLDAMLGGGFFRGSSVLVSGTAGTCKTTLAAHLAVAACRRGERTLYFAFEEAPAQICRNLRSIGLDLQPWLDQGLLRIQAARPTLFGLESHLAAMHLAVDAFQPQVVVVDPVGNFMAVGSSAEAKAMLTRLVDYLKSQQITALFTCLTPFNGREEGTTVGISSIMDTWLQLRDIESGGERNRGLYILKSRGTAHSNQIREFVLTAEGVQLVEAYLGPGGVLTGSARVAQEAQEKAGALVRAQQIKRKRLELHHKRQAMEGQVAALRAAFEAEAADLERIIEQEESREERLADDRMTMARRRNADLAADGDGLQADREDR